MTSAPLTLLIGAALANNVVLSQFLGLCPLMGSSRRLDTALGLGGATLLVLILATLATHGVLVGLMRPFGLESLKPLVFIGLIAAVVQALERLMAVYSPRLFAALGLYLPLITTNCAVLGVALLDAKQSESLFDSLLFSAGSGLGFTLVLVLFSAVRERLESAAIPAPFRGSAIGLITAGLAALAFSGFQGLGPL